MLRKNIMKHKIEFLIDVRIFWTPITVVRFENINCFLNNKTKIFFWYMTFYDIENWINLVHSFHIYHV